MVFVNIDMAMVEMVIELLKVPLFVLGILILFRANRILSQVEQSLDTIEHTAESIEDSSRTLAGILNFLGRNGNSGDSK